MCSKCEKNPCVCSVKLKSGLLIRTMEFDRKAINEDERTVALSFSSEVPVERWFGMEILDHSVGSVRMKRAKRGLPFLINHDTNDHVGRAKDITIGTDRKGRAVAHFGKSVRAEEIFQDVKDGIRPDISFAYRVYKMVLESQDKKNPSNNVYRATDWEMIEISSATVPADFSVGVNRGIGLERDIEVTGDVNAPEYTKKEKRTMCEKCGKDPCICSTLSTRTDLPPTVDIEKLEREAQSKGGTAERLRVKEILAIGKKTDSMKDAMQYIDDEKSADDFRQYIIENKFKAVPVTVDPSIGLTHKETKAFSLIRAIHAQVKMKLEGKPLDQTAPFEMECSRAVEKHLGKPSKGFFIPHEVQVRDMTVGTDSAGGYLKATNLLSGSFIDMLRNAMLVKAMGARTLTGLVGDIAIPKQSGGGTGYWVGESTDPTESQPTLAQLGLTPKTVGAYTDISRKLLLQSSIDVEALVRLDLAQVLALALDVASLHGSGSSNQPEGIINVTGIGDVAGGTNGLAPTNAHIIELESDVAVANALVSQLGYLTNAKVRGKLKQVFTNATYGEIPLWIKGESAGFGELNGYKAGVSNQVASNLVKGSSSVCSAIFFGNWADLIIALWGSLDVLVDPYTGGTQGTVRVRLLQDADIGVRHAESFSCMKDALTA